MRNTKTLNNPAPADIKLVHNGRSGYVEYAGQQYVIEQVGAGHFCIHFPSGNRHNKLQQHLDALRTFARAQTPEWYVENSSRNYQ